MLPHKAEIPTQALRFPYIPYNMALYQTFFNAYWHILKKVIIEAKNHFTINKSNPPPTKLKRLGK
jgi:hypothetical protein